MSDDIAKERKMFYSFRVIVKEIWYAFCIPH